MNTGGVTVGDTPGVVLVQGAGGSTIASVPTSGGAGSGWSCYYSDPSALLELKTGAVDPVAGERYFLWCHDASGALVEFALVTYDPANPAGTAFAAERAAQLALTQLSIPLPDIATSPGLTGPQLVGVRTWLWVEGWGPVSASATLAGVTATVTATPTGLTFDTGDGATITCADGGVAFDPTVPAVDQPDGCTHVYTDRSTVDDPDGTFPLTATITYAVTWQATNGQSGTLADQQRTTTVDVQVLEGQAVID